MEIKRENETVLVDVKLKNRFMGQMKTILYAKRKLPERTSSEIVLRSLYKQGDSFKPKIWDEGLFNKVYLVECEFEDIVILFTFTENDYEQMRDGVSFNHNLTLVDLDLTYQKEMSLTCPSSETFEKIYESFIHQLVLYVNELGLVEEKEHELETE